MGVGNSWIGERIISKMGNDRGVLKMESDLSLIALYCFKWQMSLVYVCMNGCVSVHIQVHVCLWVHHGCSNAQGCRKTSLEACFFGAICLTFDKESLTGLHLLINPVNPGFCLLLPTDLELQTCSTHLASYVCSGD